MFQLIPQTQARLGGFSVPSHLLGPKVKSTLLNTNELLSALETLQRAQTMKPEGEREHFKYCKMKMALKVFFLIKCRKLDIETTSFKREGNLGQSKASLNTFVLGS